MVPWGEPSSLKPRVVKAFAESVDDLLEPNKSRGTALGSKTDTALSPKQAGVFTPEGFRGAEGDRGSRHQRAELASLKNDAICKEQSVGRPVKSWNATSPKGEVVS